MKIGISAVTIRSKMSAVIAYVSGTLLMAFGWLCALAQGDAPQQQPRIAGIVMVFGIAPALLSVPAIHLWRERRMPQVLLAAVISFQTLFCLYVIAVEFTL
jgi:uncharacterized membrane protein (UPF0136 family)